MSKSVINVGKYDEKGFVDTFATPAQKKEWLDSGMTSNLRKKILNRAERLCKIKHMGRNEYYVGNIYEYPIPTNFNKMQKPIYKDLVPLLLLRILNSEKNHCNFTIGMWARELDMVNKNYSIVKEYHKEAAKILDTTSKDIEDFYSRADPALDNYVKHALEFLDKAGYIKYQHVHMVNKEYLKDIETDSSGNLNINIVKDTRIATEEEMEIYTKCVEIADKEMNISTPGHRYYGYKSFQWKKILKDKLSENGIKCVYETHQAYIVHRDKCEHLLKLFGNLAPKTYINRVTKDFIDMLAENAGERFCKAGNMYRGYDNLDEYVKLFSDMGLAVISPKPKKQITAKLEDVKRNNQEIKVNINTVYEEKDTEELLEIMEVE